MPWHKYMGMNPTKAIIIVEEKDTSSLEIYIHG
jgi:hypothetical protein